MEDFLLYTGLCDVLKCSIVRTIDRVYITVKVIIFQENIMQTVFT